MESPRLDIRACLLIFCGLACVNLAFDALHIAHIWAGNQPAGFEFLRDMRFDLATDRGPSERLEYAMSTLTIVTLLVAAVWSRIVAYAALAAAHAWLVADNGLELHEQIGAWISSLAGAPDDHLFGELGYFASVGLAGGAMLWMVWRATPKAHQPMISLLLAGLALIGVFAVGVDAFNSSGLWQPLKQTVIVLLEDGGEALAISANLAIAVGVLLRARAARAPMPAGAQAA